MDPGPVDGRAISIVVIDDHPAIIAGITAWCAAARPPIDVLDSGDRLITAFVEPGCKADVVVLDLQLGGVRAELDGLERLVEAGRRVVVYSQNVEPAVILHCAELGAAAYLTKAEGHEHLVPAIHTVAVDRPYTSPSMSGAILADDRPDHPRLTPKEREILLAWFVSGSKLLVAQRLHITESTVGTTIERVRIKYAAVGRPAPTQAKLLQRALEDGLITLAELREAERRVASGDAAAAKNQGER